MTAEVTLLMNKISDQRAKVFNLEQQLEDIQKKCKHKRKRATGMREFKECLSCGKILDFLSDKESFG